MTTHSSILAWRIPGTEEPNGLLSMGSHRVGHDWSDLAAVAAAACLEAGDDTVMVISLLSPSKPWQLTHGVKMEAGVRVLLKLLPSTASRLRNIINSIIQTQNSVFDDPVFWTTHVRWVLSSSLTFSLLTFQGEQHGKETFSLSLASSSPKKELTWLVTACWYFRSTLSKGGVTGPKWQKLNKTIRRRGGLSISIYMITTELCCCIAEIKPKL